MNRNKLLAALLLITALGTGCSKYTDIRTEGAIAPDEYQNYRELMNDYYTLNASVDMPDYTSDDVTVRDSLIQHNINIDFLNAYMWAPNYYSVIEEDNDWKRLYAANYSCNLTIRDVMDSKGGSTAQKQEVKAEAMVHRAYLFFTLVNMYGPQYDSATAGKDLGVPMLLKPDVSATLTRGTVQQAYDQVFADLEGALPYLPPLNNYNLFPSKAGAYALLARAYLQTRQYVKAGLYADSALQLQSTLLDYTTLQPYGYPNTINDPEVILSKIAGGYHSYSNQFLMSDTLLSLYDTNDARYSYLTADYTFDYAHYYRAYMKDKNTSSARNIGPSVPEMMLIKAEAAARAGAVTEAMDLLNTLRQKRFAAAHYVPFTASNAAGALRMVLEERRRELCFHCTRWFDQKRLNKEAAFAVTITRKNLVTGESFTLTPNSPRYLFPIPLYNIQLSPSLVQNPR